MTIIRGLALDRPAACLPCEISCLRDGSAATARVHPARCDFLHAPADLCSGLMRDQSSGFPALTGASRPNTVAKCIWFNRSTACCTCGFVQPTPACNFDSAHVGARLTLEFNMFRAISLAAFTLMLAASPVLAKKQAQENVIIADSAEKFALLVDKIRSQMATGQRYEFLSPADRKLVNDSLDKMGSLLQANGSVEAMNMGDRTRLFNEQERANGILAKNADDRLVCTRVAPTGSHRPVTDCKTYRELEEIRKDTKTQLREFKRGGP
ncbi:MAG: hypothetical protein WAR01_16105 [Dokdonella sp.]|uniref:hypothetical protein n=1 Tax=Dokdonella sp. TaxID=2291710 RepID=UPI003BAF27EC